MEKLRHFELGDGEGWEGAFLHYVHGKAQSGMTEGNPESRSRKKSTLKGGACIPEQALGEAVHEVESG